jgi:hypothetical protein
MTIQFLRRTGSPIVSGIELIPVSTRSSAPAPGRLTLRASGGRLVTLSGHLLLRGVRSARRLISIELRATRGRAFETVATVRVRPDGGFSVTLPRRARPVRVRASFAGDGAAQPQVSRVLSLRGAAR